MLSAIPLWLHLLGAAVWVGSQVMMFVVVMPSLRRTSGVTRRELLSSVTRRFGYLGLGALILLVLTGLDNISRYSPDDMFELRYGYILATKVALLLVVLVLTAYHALVVGPRLLALQLDEGAAATEVRKYRVRSIAASASVLVLSLGILFCAALLDTAFAFALA